MKLSLNGKRCSEMSPVFDYQIGAKCRAKGYAGGKRVSGIRCSEANNTGWAVASVMCEGKDDF